MDKDNETSQNGSVARRSLLKRCARVVAIVLASLIVLVVAVLTAVVVVLSPARLTPLVARYSPEYIDGTVSASRIELTFWSTFPRLSVDIDSLTLVSDALKQLDPEVRRQLPADADTLLTLRSLHGGINLAALLAGRYELYDVAVSQPAVNIVVANDSTANYNLTPPPAVEDTTRSELPELGINRFLLLNSGPLRYFSLPDSTEFTLRFSAIDANGAGSPVYSLSTEGNVRVAGLPVATAGPLLFTADGSVVWDPSAPTVIGLKSFAVSVDGTQARFDTSIDFGERLTVDHLDLTLPSVDVTRVAGYLPADVRSQLGDFDTNMNAALSFSLDHPYTMLPDTTVIPSGVLTLKIKPCRLTVKPMGLDIERLSLDAKLTIDGDAPDRSVAEVEALEVKSRVMDLDFKGTVRNMMSDPLFAGQLKGRVFAGYLPAVVREAVGGTVSGTVGANLSVRMRMSDLSAEKFHRVFARGTMSLRHFSLEMPQDVEPADTMRISTPMAMLKFDSDRRIEVNGVSTDSLLTVSVAADTINYSGSGISLFVRELSVGLGSRNVHSSADTTRINPFGGRITASVVRMTSVPDSLKIAVRELDCNAALRRYEGSDSVPQLSLSVAAGGVGIGNSDFRAAVKEPFAEMTAHLNKRKQHRAPARRVAEPTVADDSISSGLKELITRWKIAGRISATRGRFMSRSFPLATRVGDVDLMFSSDSIALHSLTLQLGRTDLKVRGDITNLEQWASRRRPSARRPMRVGVKITSDTVDIDQIIASCVSGTATGEMSVATDDIDEYAGDVMSQESVSADSAGGGPFIIPVNLEAMLDVEARNVFYSDMLLHDFKGQLQTRAGIMRLRDLSAAGEMGRIDLSALYSTLDRDSIEFGMGMKLTDFYIDRFLQVMPSIDSLLPALRDLSGIVNADVAATTRLDSEMNFVIPTLKAVIDIEGDSLVLLDDETFKSMSKWLVFKNKKRNLIDHMNTKIVVDSAMMSIYPFVFDIDRYRLGVMGSNDLDMNLNYHVSVLKSPLPWKFGINISGTPDDMKIRLGGAKVKENGEGVIEQLAIADTTRINLISQLETLFNRGVGASRSSFMRRRAAMPLPVDSIAISDSVIVTLTDSILP